MNTSCNSNIPVIRRFGRALAGRVDIADESGVALVEFALVLPVIAFLLFGMVDFGKAFNYWIDETHLANQASRFAAVNRNPGPGATLQETIRDQADSSELRNGGTGSVPNALQVCISFPNGTSDVGDPVRVTVTTTYNFMALLNIAGKAITASSTMRLEAKPTNFGAGCA
jgi:Flp pilus assembly protein TadG